MPEAKDREDFPPGPEGDETWRDWLLARSIQRRSEVIGHTHWTFAQLDDQESVEVERMLMHLNKKRGLELVKSKLGKQ